MNANRNNSGGGRAAAAITVSNQAAYTEILVGSKGQSTVSSENRSEEKAIASVSVARTWSEGEKSEFNTTSGEKMPMATIPTEAVVSRARRRYPQQMSDFHY